MSVPFELEAFLERVEAGSAAGPSSAAGPGSAAGAETVGTDRPVRVGTPFRLVIEARHAPGEIALLPEALELGSQLGERTFARRHQRRQDGDAEVDVYRLELVPFEAGEITIPAIPLAVGSTVSETPELVVTVETTFTRDELPIATSTQPAALAALEEMAAPDPPARRVEVFDPTLLWTLLVVAGLGLVAYLFLRRRTQAPAPRAASPAAPARPAHDVALAALETLQARDLMAKGDFKEHYTELSMILRAYVGDRYAFESVELTLDELLNALRGRVSKELEVDTLMAVLAAADHVKFAKRIPKLGDGYEDLERARRIVTRSAPEQARAKNGEASP